MRPSTSTVSRRAARLLSALLVLVVGACDGSSRYRSPVAPGVPDALPPTPPPPAPPAPPATDLTGAWTGTKVVTYDEIDGGGGCEELATAVFEQHGGEVSGTLFDGLGCGSSSEYRIEGVLDGTQLRARFPDLGWGVFGEVAGDRLIFAAFNVRWELRR